MSTSTEEILHRHKKTGARVRIISEWDDGDWFMVEDQDGRLYTAYKTELTPDESATKKVQTLQVKDKAAQEEPRTFPPDQRLNINSATARVLDAAPDVFNHNVETIPRLYRRIRPQAGYQQSLDVLAFSRRHRPQVLTKSGLMVGLGETDDELYEAIDDLLAAGIEPWLTCFHWDFPLALYRRGGWLNRDSADWFAEYARMVADVLSDRVAHWMKAGARPSDSVRTLIDRMPPAPAVAAAARAAAPAIPTSLATASMASVGL